MLRSVACRWGRSHGQTPAGPRDRRDPNTECRVGGQSPGTTPGAWLPPPQRTAAIASQTQSYWHATQHVTVRVSTASRVRYGAVRALLARTTQGDYASAYCLHATMVHVCLRPPQLENATDVAPLRRYQMYAKPRAQS